MAAEISLHWHSQVTEIFRA